MTPARFFCMAIAIFMTVATYSQNDYGPSGNIKDFREQEEVSVTKVDYPRFYDKSPDLRDIPIVEPLQSRMAHESREYNRFERNPVTLQKDYTLPQIADPVFQGQKGSRKSGMVMNFPGLANPNNSGVPDTEGDVGPNHFFQMINFSFAIWDKAGNLLYGPADNITLWDGFPGP